VHFHQSNTGSVVYTADDCGVVTWRQLCDNRRLPSVARSVAAILNIDDLAPSDNPADDRMRPVIIRGNQCPRAVMQLQCRITQHVGNAILSKLRANRANTHSLRASSLNNEPANHHVVACLNEGTRGNISESCCLDLEKANA